jgi:DMSO/TMAO reductase YedYZ molybdopterin-dependent catalytic subunit
MLPDGRPRLPRGQFLTKRFPVLTHGETPQVEVEDWEFRVWGHGMSKELSWSWQEFLELGEFETTRDFHCVTTWSRYDNKWSGVSATNLWQEIEQHLDVKPEAVMFHCYGGYTTNLRVEDLLAEGNLFATHHDSKPLTKPHGGPMRFVCHHLYAWKSPKWVCGMEILDKDKRGFWERHGYHNHADPWLEERYSYQEGPEDRKVK